MNDITLDELYEQHYRSYLNHNTEAPHLDLMIKKLDDYLTEQAIDNGSEYSSTLDSILKTDAQRKIVISYTNHYAYHEIFSQFTHNNTSAKPAQRKKEIENTINTALERLEKYDTEEWKYLHKHGLASSSKDKTDAVPSRKKHSTTNALNVLEKHNTTEWQFLKANGFTPDDFSSLECQDGFIGFDKEGNALHGDQNLDKIHNPYKQMKTYDLSNTTYYVEDTFKGLTTKHFRKMRDKLIENGLSKKEADAIYSIFKQ